MRTTGRIIVLICLLVSGGAMSAWADEAAVKWAVVDMAEVIRNHPKSESGRMVLEQQLDEFELERNNMLQELEQKKEAFEKARDESKNKALSESAREEIRSEARGMLEELMQDEQEVTRTVAQRRKELTDNKKRILDSILVEIEEVIRAFAVKQGYALVLDSSATGMSGSMSVLYYQEQNDITADILKELGVSKEEVKE